MPALKARCAELPVGSENPGTRERPAVNTIGSLIRAALIGRPSDVAVQFAVGIVKIERLVGVNVGYTARVLL